MLRGPEGKGNGKRRPGISWGAGRVQNKAQDLLPGGQLPLRAGPSRHTGIRPSICIAYDFPRESGNPCFYVKFLIKKKTHWQHLKNKFNALKMNYPLVHQFVTFVCVDQRSDKVSDRKEQGGPVDRHRAGTREAWILLLPHVLCNLGTLFGL